MWAHNDGRDGRTHSMLRVVRRRRFIVAVCDTVSLTNSASDCGEEFRYGELKWSPDRISRHQVSR